MHWATRTAAWRAAAAGRLRASDPVLRALVVAFAVVRLAEVGFTAPSVYPDTKTYRTGGWLDFSLTSIDGRSIRPWGVTIWMALWGSDRLMVYAQVALSVIAWSLLAVTATATIARRWVRLSLVGTLFVLATTPQVAGWDLAILSESVSISSGLLALAAGLRLARAPGWGRLALFVAAALWFTMTRPNVFPTLLAWGVALLVVSLVRGRVLVGVVAVLLMLAISAYAYVYNIRSDVTWKAANGVSRTTVAYAYPISQNDPVAGQVIADLRHSDAPRCMIPGSTKTLDAHGPTAWVTQQAGVCPGMDEWLTKNWNRWWATWLLTHPAGTAQIIDAQLPNALSQPVYTAVKAATPQSVASVFFGSPAIPQGGVIWKTYRTEPILLWVAAGAVLVWLGRRRRGHGTGADQLLLGLGMAGAVLSAVSSTLLIQTQAGEVGRESAGVSVLLVASAVVLVAVGLDRVLPPLTVRGRRVSTTVGGPDDYAPRSRESSAWQTASVGSRPPASASARDGEAESLDESVISAPEGHGRDRSGSSG